MIEYITTTGETVKITLSDPGESFCAFVKCRAIIENREMLSARAELMRDYGNAQDRDDLEVFCEKSDRYRSDIYALTEANKGSFLDILGVLLLTAEVEEWKSDIMQDLGIEETCFPIN